LRAPSIALVSWLQHNIWNVVAVSSIIIAGITAAAATVRCSPPSHTILRHTRIGTDFSKLGRRRTMAARDGSRLDIRCVARSLLKRITPRFNTIAAPKLYMCNGTFSPPSKRIASAAFHKLPPK
jgi:hypothetical protein